METIRTRFAPSPTGTLHVGGARTALFCWLYARHLGGQFVLRIEDTDRERSTQASVDAILDGLAWLGIDYDEGPFYQTQRFDRYEHYIEKLLDAGLAYYCYCSKEELEAVREAQKQRGQKPRYDGRYRNFTGTPPPGVEPVVRFKNPVDGEVVVDDLIRGPMLFSNAELDDLIIARPDGTPTYNFTVVVDDLEMAITHVIRGDDHINNTPRQMNILHALGGSLPKYAHVPMILGEDGQRLSKRHGAVSVTDYRTAGYLPEALVNYLVRLGWSHGDQEIFSLDELVAAFDIADVNRAAARMDTEKLQWLNQHYIKQADGQRLAECLSEQLERLGLDITKGPALGAVVAAQRERAKTLKEMAENSVYFFSDFESFEEKAARKNLKPAIADALRLVRERLAELSEWHSEAIHQCIVNVAEQQEMKLGKLGQPLRVATTGGAISPPIDITLELVGQARTLERIDRALEWIAKQVVDA